MPLFKYIKDGQIIPSFTLQGDELKTLIDLFANEKGGDIIELELFIGKSSGNQELVGSDGLVYFKQNYYGPKKETAYWPLPIYQLTGLKKLIYNVPEERPPFPGTDENMALSLFKIKGLEELEITKGILGDDPPYNISRFVGNYPNLTKLEISLMHYMTELPKEIGNLKTLIILEIHGCKQLKTLPKEIENLTNLETLIVSAGYKPRLRKINFEALPDVFGSLKKLSYIMVDGCLLQNFPPSIGKLLNLEYLDFGDDKFTDMPEYVLRLPNLRYIYIVGNPIVNDINKLSNAYRIYRSIHTSREYKFIAFDDPKEQRDFEEKARPF